MPKRYKVDTSVCREGSNRILTMDTQEGAEGKGRFGLDCVVSRNLAWPSAQRKGYGKVWSPPPPHGLTYDRFQRLQRFQHCKVSTRTAGVTDKYLAGPHRAAEAPSGYLPPEGIRAGP